MVFLEEVIELFDEVEDGLELSGVIVVECEDGIWYCQRDIELQETTEFKMATENMIELYRKSKLTLEEKICELEEESKIAEPWLDTRACELDYYGSRAQAINESMAGAFEPAFGSDFSL